MPAASVILSPSVAPAIAAPPAPNGGHGAGAIPTHGGGAADPSAVTRDRAHAAPTFAIPGSPALPVAPEAPIAPSSGATVSRALWLGVLLGVLGSAILFALAYAIFLAR